MRRVLLASLFAVACSAPSFSHPPSAPAYRPLSSPDTLRDSARFRARLDAEDHRLRAGAPPAAAALHDAVEQIVAELGQACTPRNPGGDGLHWTVACSTETLFAPGRSAPNNTAVIEHWRAVGRIVGDLSRRRMQGDPRLRLAVSGFADHIEFANHAAALCDDLTRFWGVTFAAPADEAAFNRSLSFCRAASMAREIACATVPGPCADHGSIDRTSLSVGVFGGGTARLDRDPSRFHTHLAGPAGEMECACHPIPPATLGPSWASSHRGTPVEACPAVAAPDAPPALFDCDSARRVELDLWLEVTPGAAPSTDCALTSRDPDARSLVCLQEAVVGASHQNALRAPEVRAPVDRCANATHPDGWLEARTGPRPPCVAELSE
ncbi:MAG: hypothetical protein U0326_04715 [Polyangiales bacterium]